MFHWQIQLHTNFNLCIKLKMFSMAILNVFFCWFVWTHSQLCMWLVNCVQVNHSLLSPLDPSYLRDHIIVVFCHMGHIGLERGKSAWGSLYLYFDPKIHLFKSCNMKIKVIFIIGLGSKIQICHQKQHRTPRPNYKYGYLAWLWTPQTGPMGGLMLFLMAYSDSIP